MPGPEELIIGVGVDVVRNIIESQFGPDPFAAQKEQTRLVREEVIRSGFREAPIFRFLTSPAGSPAAQEAWRAAERRLATTELVRFVEAAGFSLIPQAQGFTSRTWQGFNPVAFAQVTPFQPTGGNPAWRSSVQAAGSFQGF